MFSFLYIPMKHRIIYSCIATLLAGIYIPSTSFASLTQVEKQGKVYLVEKDEAQTSHTQEDTYTLDEVLAATQLSNRILQEQPHQKRWWIFDILLRLETYETSLVQQYRINIINLSQKLILQHKRPSPKGYIHLATPIFEWEKSPTQDVIVATKDKEEADQSTTDMQEKNLHNDRIDHAYIRDTWIWWTNTLRTSRGLPIYTHEPVLSQTALTRSQVLSNKWIADHKRTPDASYYDYEQIESRFADQWVSFVNHNRSTFTENIWRSSYSCDQEDCTDEAVTAIRRIFDYFVSEEADDGVHWRTLIHPRFSQVWVELTIDSSQSKLYWVMHYAVEAVEH